MAQYGIRTPDNVVITDAHWDSMGAVMRGYHGFGYSRASELGVLVIWNGKEWIDVYSVRS